MLSDKEIEIIINVLKPYNPKRIGIFGSYARGENTEESDVDILYQFAEPISLFQKSDLLENLKNKLNKNVDMVSEKFVHPYFKESIAKDLKLIYGS